MKKRGLGGRTLFGIILWREGRPVGLRFPYDSDALGWATTNVTGSVLSQALAALGADGWQVVGRCGDNILLQRPKSLAQSLD